MLLAAAAQAATTEDIFALYARGDYEQAVRQGEASHTAPGLAIAARAVLADDVLRDTPCLSCLERAEALSRQAVAADPHYALRPGLAGGFAGLSGAHHRLGQGADENSPAQSRAALDAAVADDPKNAFAVSALGGWHIEIVRGGGAFLARLSYGARGKRRAGTVRPCRDVWRPDNVAVRYQIGLSLAGFNPDKYRARIAPEFKAAMAATPGHRL